jgi:hypothetical protein
MLADDYASRRIRPFSVHIQYGVTVSSSKGYPVRKYAFFTDVHKGRYASLYDIDTGLTLRIKRKGGTNHMDVEPATKADTATLKKIAGGTFSWKSHAVVLIAKGRYIAAAINTMPHGEYTIKDNGFPGQFCLHMVGSKTHETDRVNPEHQKSIERVLKWSKSP